MKHHLEHCSKNASYTSPAIQNELITLAGDDVKNQILASARAAKWFSIMADECVDSSTIEQMSLCIRYVERIGTSGDDFEVREEFIGFVELEKADAESISSKIVEYLKKCALDLCNLRGQGYDGATVMSGKVSGVCTRIQQIQPRALYHHCRSHVLNLVLSSSCQEVPDIRNLFCFIKKISWFLGGSAKRKSILKRYVVGEDISELIIEEQEGEEPSNDFLQWTKNEAVPKLCETRWSARVITLSSFISKYKAIHLALKDIGSESSDADTRTNAISYAKLMESSSFIVALVIAQHILSISQPLSLALQATNCDIVKAYQDAALCKDTVLSQRQDSKFIILWRKATVLAESIDTVLSKPRTAKRSIFRNNVECESESCIEYYRRNVYFPFIDHCVTQFNQRFPESAQSLYLGYKLLPSKVSSMSDEDLEAIEEYYGPDLPHKSTFQGEVKKWKTKAKNLSAQNHSLLDTLMLADTNFFPNIHEIMKLMLTIPVGAVPCERSFSAMRRLKDWSRTNMTESRLCGLALLYTHRDMTVNVDNVIRQFGTVRHRRIGALC